MKDFEGKKMCMVAGKICYTEREAGRILNICSHNSYSKKVKRAKVVPQRKYFCTACECYHLTSKKNYVRGDVQLRKTEYKRQRNDDLRIYYYG